jgi:hypothetical protein
VPEALTEGNGNGIGDGMVPPGKVMSVVKGEFSAGSNTRQFVTANESVPGAGLVVTVTVAEGLHCSGRGDVLAPMVSATPLYVCDDPGFTGAPIALTPETAVNVAFCSRRGSGPLTTFSVPVVVTQT